MGAQVTTKSREQNRTGEDICILLRNKEESGDYIFGKWGGNAVGRERSETRDVTRSMSNRKGIEETKKPRMSV